jgi:wyosine [tRNA(Phe)-imidazoG37] synthetase (radical SAM superfamily)
MISAEVALCDIRKLVRSVPAREKSVLTMGMLEIARECVSEADMLYVILNSAYDPNILKEEVDDDFDVNDPRR